MSGLRAALSAMADAVASGTTAFMADYKAAESGISTRVNGEAAALIVEQRAQLENGLRRLLADHPEPEGGSLVAIGRDTRTGTPQYLGHVTPDLDLTAWLAAWETVGYTHVYVARQLWEAVTVEEAEATRSRYPAPLAHLERTRTVL